MKVLLLFFIFHILLSKSFDLKSDPIPIKIENSAGEQINHPKVGENKNNERILLTVKSTTELMEKLVTKSIETYGWKIKKIENESLIIFKLENEVERGIFNLIIKPYHEKGSEMGDDTVDKNFSKMRLILTNAPNEDPGNFFPKRLSNVLAYERSFTEKETPIVGEFLKTKMGEYQVIYNKLEALSTLRNTVNEIKDAFAQIPGSDFAILGDHVTKTNAAFNVKSKKLGRTYLVTIKSVSDDFFTAVFQTDGSIITMFLSKYADNNIKSQILNNFSRRSQNEPNLISSSQAIDAIKENVLRSCPNLASQSVPPTAAYANIDFMSYSNPKVAPNCYFASTQILVLKIEFGFFHYFHITKEFPQLKTEELNLPDMPSFRTKEIKSIADDGVMIQTIKKLLLSNKESALKEDDILKSLKKIFPKMVDDQIDQKVKAKLEKNGGFYLKKWQVPSSKLTINLFKDSSQFFIELIKIDPKQTTSSVVYNIPFLNGYDSLQVIEQAMKSFEVSG